MKKIILLVLIVGGILFYRYFENSNTITISGSEEIQPILSTIKVSGDSDTSVVFTDVNTNEQYVVGYITHGVTEKIKLKKGSWYKVEGKGKITLYPVKVRIE